VCACVCVCSYVFVYVCVCACLCYRKSESQTVNWRNEDISHARFTNGLSVISSGYTGVKREEERHGVGKEALCW
jgi:hypothetical protein